TGMLVGPISAGATALAPAPQAISDHPLSYEQRSMWFLHQQSPENSVYNIAAAVRIQSGVDVAASHRAFQALVDRHACLRTSFGISQGEPVQRIHDRMEVCFHHDDASEWTSDTIDERLIKKAYQPFDLGREPLFRVNLFTRSEREHILLLVVHHIIADFWSLAVLVHEFGILYQEEKSAGSVTLPPLTLQYADYSRWQSEMLAGQKGEWLWQYWQKQLSGNLPVLNLPTDRPRSPIQSYRGASHYIEVGKDLTRRLKALSYSYKATLYMTLLAAFQTLLHRYANQDEILVGSPAAGRSRAELAGLVGYFVNPLTLRTD